MTSLQGKLILVLFAIAVPGCDSDTTVAPDAAGGEHIAIVEGNLRDPMTARATADMGAMGAEAPAKQLGDVAHIVGLGASVLGTAPTRWTAIDRWTDPAGMEQFYGDAGFKAGFAALVSESAITEFRVQPTWHGWGDLDSGAGAPRWYVIVRGTFKDPATAQAGADMGAAGFEATAKSLGDVAHVVATGRDDAAAFLAIDVWTSPDHIAAFYTDPKFVQGAAALFDGTPTITVLHATDWYQWGSTGKPALDGTWKVTSFSCNGQSQPVGDFVLDVRAGAGTFHQGFDPGCVATLDEAYAYTDATSFGITPKTIACDPSTTCESIFGATCLPLPPPTAFTWALDGDTLSFTRVATGPGDQPCQPGDQVAFSMARQAL